LRAQVEKTAARNLPPRCFGANNSVAKSRPIASHQSEDAVDAGPDHLQERVLGEVGIAGVVQGLGEGPGQADALVERADGQQPGVAGQLARRRLDDQRRAEKIQDVGPDIW
jgi:hypothetical protein